MRVVLCHHCWTWGFPQGKQCVECQQVIELDELDPTVDELQQLLGTATIRLAPVTWDRPKLPPQGDLWGTTTGLLFWPRLVQQPNGSIVPAAAATRGISGWSLFSLWRPSSPSQPSADAESNCLPAADVDGSLGPSFLEAPGAAFFPRDRLVKVTCHRRSWSLHRTIGRPLRFVLPPSSPEEASSWRAFFQQDDWRGIAAVS